jgi:hypothetical protein
MKAAIIAGCAALFLATVTAHAASRTMICSGEWVDMRGSGLSIGECDINYISPKELRRIENICGEPGNPYTHENEGVQCRIRALVTPYVNPRGAGVFKVLKVLRVIGNEDDQ